MQCPACRQENPPQAKFCLECATPFARRCAACGTQLPPAAKFCFECAKPVDGPAVPPARFTAPAAYTPKHLAERIINSKASVEGERKFVTVLFADLKGSTELLADRDPEEARKLLDPVLEHMIEAVHRFEGTVNQVMGDGIMALFGAPIAHEDHAVRACYAALRMQESVKKYAEGVRRVEGIPIRIRVGLNSGDVVVRAIGSDLHMDYTAVGQTTHLAARMEQIAAPETIAITPTTLALAEGFVDVYPLGPIAVKGLATPVDVFELRGASAVRSRLQAVAARGLTKFVGRSAEMTQLDDAVERARAGRGQVVALVGEAGVGKSRIVWEFTHSHRTQGCLVVEAPAVSYGRATAYFPLVELLKAYFVVEPRDDTRRIREKITGRVLALDRSLEPTLPALFALLDAALEDAVWSASDRARRRQLTLDGVKRLLLRESQVQPLVLVFEDLHWIDGETQAFLNALVERIPTASVLLLVNYRPEYQHSWGSKTYYRQVRIDALPPARADELLDDLIGSDPSVAQLKRLLIERTEGNPFFIEESVRSLSEVGSLEGSRGAYRARGSIETWAVPATAQAIIAARIDRLEPEDKRRLQAAAVVGKDVPLALLAAIADESEEELLRGLERLQAAEFLYEARLFPDVEYTFKHALTHEVAYGTLLHDRRRDLHARIVAAIESLHRDRLPEHVERLAGHALRGEQWRKAAQYYRQAANKAFDWSASREAAASFEQALFAVMQLPESPETVTEAIDLRFDIRNTLLQAVMTFDSSGILPHLQRARADAERLGDRRRLGRAADLLSNYHYNVADLTASVAEGRLALQIATEIDDFGLAVAARFHLGCAYYNAGDYDQAISLLDENAGVLDGPAMFPERFGLAAPPAILSRIWLANALGEQGAFAKAIAEAEKAIRIADSTERLLDRAYAYRAMSVHLLQGDVERALPTLERGYGMSQAEDFRTQFRFFGTYLGLAYILLNRLADACQILERVTNEIGGHRESTAPSSLRHLAEAYLRSHRPREASMRAEAALAAARDQGQRGDEAHALRVLAGVAALEGAAARAEDLLQQALALAAQLRMRPLIAHCHAGLARLYRRTGKRAESDEQFATATTKYRDMGMTYWLERAERESES